LISKFVQEPAWKKKVKNMSDIAPCFPGILLGRSAKKNMPVTVHVDERRRYRVAKSHKMAWLCKPFCAKKPHAVFVDHFRKEICR